MWSYVPRLWLAVWLLGSVVITGLREWLRRAYFTAQPSAAEVGPWICYFIAGVFISVQCGESLAHFRLRARMQSQRCSRPSFWLAWLPAACRFCRRFAARMRSVRGAVDPPIFDKVSGSGRRSIRRNGYDAHRVHCNDVADPERHYRSVTESLVLRFSNRELLDDLAAARDHQHAINRELEAQIRERESTEEALRRAYDDLEGKVRERTAQLAQTNDVLRTEKELFRVTLASIGDAVITTDATAHITYLNAVAEHLTGWSDGEARGQPLAEVFRILDETTREPAQDPIDRCLQGEESVGQQNHSLLVCRDQRELNIDTSVAPIRDDHNTIIGAVLIFRDVTAQRKLAHQLSYQATHDALTDLVNRYEFERRLIHLLASANPYVAHALLYLDLDQFKVVNDTCGHVAGDELLRQVAALLRSKLRSRDTLARLGGDEFGVLLEHCSVGEAKRIANTLRELLQSFRFGWQDKTFTIGVSIGLVPIVRAGETVSSVLSAADSSCYAAKEKGRNRVHVYQADDSTLAQREGEMRWMPRIQQALADERFCLYYQPIVPVGPSTVEEKHGEILLRMLDEEGHLVPPGAFLPAAERYGLMPAIDRWVVSKTLESLSAMADSEADVTFAINLSAQSLGAGDFLEFVTEQLDQTRVSPRRLCFEITESSAVSELTHVLRFIETLKALGCRFSLDDFGTGLSSFSYLKTLPVNYLKIDGGFVRDLATDAIDRAMVEAVHHIGHIMGLRTIAECVESNAILEKLREIGVDYCQGYALGRPRPLDLT